MKTITSVKEIKVSIDFGPESEKKILPVDRLAHIGKTALGAFVYEPDHSDTSIGDDVSLDELAHQFGVSTENIAMIKSKFRAI